MNEHVVVADVTGYDDVAWLSGSASKFKGRPRKSHQKDFEWSPWKLLSFLRFLEQA